MVFKKSIEDGHYYFVQLTISNQRSLILNLIGWLLCQRLHIAVLVGVPLAHGQFITVLFNLFVTFVHLLPTCILYYVYLMLLAIGPNKVFMIPDNTMRLVRYQQQAAWWSTGINFADTSGQRRPEEDIL